MINSNVSFHIMMLFPGSSLTTNYSLYLCNLCNVDSYKALTVIIFLNVEEIESLIEIQYAT